MEQFQQLENAATERIVIAGGPGTGKTTRASEIRHRGPIIRTDWFAHLGWEGQKRAAALQIAEPGPWVLEGVQAARGLRHYLRQHPHAKPCDCVIWLIHPLRPDTYRQRSLRAGVDGIMAKLLPQLAANGVVVVKG